MIDLAKSLPRCIGLLSIAALIDTSLAAAAPVPSLISSVTKHREFVGQCFSTRVKSVASRLQDGGKSVPGSGSMIELDDGHYNVDYDQIPGIDQSKTGDAVRLCVLHLPTSCPRGDTRGIRYHGLNLRTKLTWVAGDAEHICGGA